MYWNKLYAISLPQTANHKAYKPFGVCNLLNTFRFCWLFVSSYHPRAIFSRHGHNVRVVDRCFEIGSVHYRDSKYNIALHKIGVKLFDRPFDRPMFEGCSYGSPNCEDKVVAGRNKGMSPQPDLRTANRSGIDPYSFAGHELYRL